MLEIPTVSRRVLLDTHALIWALDEPHRLSQEARQLIGDATRSRVFVSAVSAQELAIKSALGKLSLSDPSQLLLLPRLVERSEFEWLSITPSHALALSTLPFFADHRDPFDRQLIAQARVEDLCLVTRDARIIDGRYGIDFVVA